MNNIGLIVIVFVHSKTRFAFQTFFDLREILTYVGKLFNQAKHQLGSRCCSQSPTPGSNWICWPQIKDGPERMKM